MKCPICNTEIERDGPASTHYQHDYNLSCPLDKVTLHGADWNKLAAALAAAEQRGFERARDAADRMAENINPASNKERVNNIPGGDAMGAIIEYRDRIRALQPQQPNPYRAVDCTGTSGD